MLFISRLACFSGIFFGFARANTVQMNISECLTLDGLDAQNHVDLEVGLV